jgi:hypothetical protein
MTTLSTIAAEILNPKELGMTPAGGGRRIGLGIACTTFTRHVGSRRDR